jgi:hypothetical protein
VVSLPRCGVFLGSANSGYPAKTAVVLTPSRCVISLAFASSEDSSGVHAASLCGFPSRSQTACVQQGWRWCLRRLCWPTAAVAGLVRGCAGSDDGGGVLAASLLPLVMDLGSGVGDGPVRTAVGFSSPRSGVSLWFANRVCPARMAVVLTPPLLAYGCWGWVCLRVCRQRRQRWSFRRLALCFSRPVGGDDGAVPVIVAVGSSSSF